MGGNRLLSKVRPGWQETCLHVRALLEYLELWGLLHTTTSLMFTVHGLPHVLYNPRICWRDNTTGQKQSRRFLKCIGGSFLAQMVKEMMRVDAMLNLELTTREGQVGDVNAGRSLSCSDYEMASSGFWWREQGKKLDTALGSEEQFGLLRDLLGRILWQVVRRAGWFFKDCICQAEEWSILMCRKSSKDGLKPVWMRKKLLTKLKHEKEAYRRVKQGQETQEEYKGTVQACRSRIRKASPIWG